MDLQMQCLRDLSQKHKNNESTGEGKQTSYPVLSRTVPNSPFRSQVNLGVPNLNGISSP